MKKWLFSLSVVFLLFGSGCSKGAVTPSANEEEEGVEEVGVNKTDEAEVDNPQETSTVEVESESTGDEAVDGESGAVLESEGEGAAIAVTDDSSERDYYWSETKAEMDAVNQQIDDLWKTHLIDAFPEKAYDEAWSTTFMDSLGVLAVEYEALIDPLEQIPVSGLGEYAEHVDDFQMALLDSLIARMDATILLIDSIETTGGFFINMDAYNIHVDDAMEFQEEALKHQALLEQKLEALD